MPIAFDASIQTVWAGPTSSRTQSFTTAGSNLKLFVGVHTFSASLITATGVTFNGTPMTLIDRITDNIEGNFQATEFWYLDAAPATTADIIATLSGTADFCRLSASSFTGVTQTGIDASQKAQGGSSTTSPTCNVSVVRSDCWLVGTAFSRYTANLTAGSGTTVRASSTEGAAIGDSNGVVGTGSQTLAFVAGSASAWPGVIYASFSEAGANNSTTSPIYYQRKVFFPV